LGPTLRVRAGSGVQILINRIAEYTIAKRTVARSSCHATANVRKNYVARLTGARATAISACDCALLRFFPKVDFARP
jgi:hypothetical protein